MTEERKKFVKATQDAMAKLMEKGHSRDEAVAALLQQLHTYRPSDDEIFLVMKKYRLGMEDAAHVWMVAQAVKNHPAQSLDETVDDLVARMGRAPLQPNDTASSQATSLSLKRIVPSVPATKPPVSHPATSLTTTRPQTPLQPKPPGKLSINTNTKSTSLKRNSKIVSKGTSKKTRPRSDSVDAVVSVKLDAATTTNNIDPTIPASTSGAAKASDVGAKSSRKRTSSREEDACHSTKRPRRGSHNAPLL